MGAAGPSVAEGWSIFRPASERSESAGDLHGRLREVRNNRGDEKGGAGTDVFWWKSGDFWCHLYGGLANFFANLVADEPHGLAWRWPGDVAGRGPRGLGLGWPSRARPAIGFIPQSKVSAQKTRASAQI